MINDKPADGVVADQAAIDTTQQPQGDKPSQPQGDKPEQPAERLFSQADVDRIIAKRLNEAKAAWEKSKELTELERLKAENQELQTKVQLATAFEGFEKAAVKAGARNVRGLFKLLRDEMEITSRGEIKDLDVLLKQAKAEYPEFFLQASQQANNDFGAKQQNAPQQMNDLIRRAFGIKQ